jgi:hypothetical protein
MISQLEKYRFIRMIDCYNFQDVLQKNTLKGCGLWFFLLSVKVAIFFKK